MTTRKGKITAATVARTICLLLALVNQGLAIAGVSPLPIEDDTVAQIISLAATVTASLTAWWKNNSFTQAAIAGDAVMKAYREE